MSILKTKTLQKIALRNWDVNTLMILLVSFMALRDGFNHSKVKLKVISGFYFFANVEKVLHINHHF